MERMQVVFGHLPRSVQLSPVSGAGRFVDRPDDIVVISALRTPIGKANRGSFKDTYADDLLSAVIGGVMKESGVTPQQIGDICVGNVNDSKAAFTARVAQFYSGIPETVPVYTTNRQCSSGLQAFMNVAGSIRNNQCDMGIGAGFEQMTMNKGNEATFNPNLFEVEKAKNCLVPMGITSENVAEKYGLTREEQDQFALTSQLRAFKAQKEGLFKDEIVPVPTTIKDKDGNETKITVTKDDGIRPTTLEGLLKLRPAFKKGGTTTAGNSSQVSDGAAAVLLARRSEAVRLNLPILGVLRGYAVGGCPPELMGIGPAIAIPMLLSKTGMTTEEIEIFEINEAFASQAKYCVDKLGIPSEKVNPKGGAIALGHPLGCTGARQIATLLHELKRRGKKSYGVVSMCMGTGMGAAAMFEYPGPAK
ncbi:3-ketoacyl-CoA thiolase B, peroxisomal-like [Mizuhopecten yessoensis]|uniref:3-ketoacyl-CoA thiolase B, peroxisomal-like n=1 Tax=Mizuhopecten yessoensis TaxID=6573 RepID=UPI000B45BF76|nr:3-ketoacyl-CoA thiolase B, peroxisomal-like [Mizuhopecten yessoensis]